jgi:hypothetical protein
LQEKPTDSTVFDAYKNNPERLMQLCELKGIEFNLMDINETIKRLFNKLQEEISQMEKEREKALSSSSTSGAVSSVPTSTSTLTTTTTITATTNPFEMIAQPVIERAKLLLRIVPSIPRVRHPSADSANPFAIHRDRTSTSGSGTSTSLAPPKSSDDRFMRFRQSQFSVGPTKDQNELDVFVWNPIFLFSLIFFCVHTYLNE